MRTYLTAKVDHSTNAISIIISLRKSYSVKGSQVLGQPLLFVQVIFIWVQF